MGPERGATPQLSIVIPAYNEEDRLPQTLDRIFEYVQSRRLDAEALVVDDGSTDDTSGAAARVLRGRPGRLLRNEENRGKGYSVRHGVLSAAGRWVLMTDADLSTPIEEHGRLAAAARDRDLDVVIGSRALPDSKIEVRQNRVRETMGKTFNVFVRAITGLSFRDTQCGFKLLDRRRTLPLFRRMVVDGFAFDAELLFVAVRYGLKVADVPVVWRNDERSKVGLVGDPLRMLVDLARVRWRFRRGLYNPEPEAEPLARGGERPALRDRQ